MVQEEWSQLRLVHTISAEITRWGPVAEEGADTCSAGGEKIRGDAVDGVHSKCCCCSSCCCRCCCRRRCCRCCCCCVWIIRGFPHCSKPCSSYHSISVHPDSHSWTSSTTGERSWDGGATELFTEGSIGHLNPVKSAGSISFNVKIVKGQLNNVSYRRLQSPYFIIIVVII